MSDVRQLLLNKSSRPIKPGTPPLSAGDVSKFLAALPGWTNAGGKEIRKEYKFKDYHETMDFVNKVAAIAHKEDHHPDMEVGYNRCVVKYSTHSVGGLSENDFICAAKIDALPRT